MANIGQEPPRGYELTLAEFAGGDVELGVCGRRMFRPVATADIGNFLDGRSAETASRTDVPFGRGPGVADAVVRSRGSVLASSAPSADYLPLAGIWEESRGQADCVVIRRSRGSPIRGSSC